MPDRLSKSQIDKLGERLRESAEISAEDLTLLQEVRSEHDAAMSVVADRLADELGLEPGSRLKTVGTIIDKLRREHIRLSQMQDIAGVRVVRAMGLDEQDALAKRITALFDGARVADRRERPSHGYRAVHVIVALDARNVEIQVRTELQHLWAQVFERFADRYGRGVRYGLPPDDPTATVPVLQASTDEFVTFWLDVTTLVQRVEHLSPGETDAESLGPVREVRNSVRTLLRNALSSLSMGESLS